MAKTQDDKAGGGVHLFRSEATYVYTPQKFTTDEFFTAPFKTYTGTDHTVRVPIFVNTDCQIDPENVVDLLTKTALGHPSVLDEPEPTVFLLEYENNTAKFQINIWLNNPLDSPRVQSEVKRLIWKAFEDHSVALPFPEMELHFPKQVNVNTQTYGSPSTT